MFFFEARIMFLVFHIFSTECQVKHKSTAKLKKGIAAGCTLLGEHVYKEAS